MARTTIAAQMPNAAGIVPAYAAADGVNGMQYANSGRGILHVKNGSAAAINVTIPTPGTVDGLALADLVVAIAAGAERMLSLRNEQVYRQIDGYTYVDFSAAATVTVAVFEGGAA